MIVWERDPRKVGVMLGVAALASLPYFASLSGVDLLPADNALHRLLEDHRYRELSGFACLAVLLCSVAYSLRKRTRIPVLYPRRRPIAAHMILGSLMLPLVFLHTGGEWGENLNGWLLASFLGVVFVALSARRMQTAYRIGEATGDTLRLKRWTERNGRVWLELHALLAASLVVLLAFHILSVYYF